jgi:hypothetical protein
MSISLQNLRSVTPGVAPASLLPGQLCFNVSDELMFIGDGSNFKTNFDGSQTLGISSQGWFSLPLSLSGFSEYLLENPEVYSTPPEDGDVLVYSGSLGKPIWVNNPGTAAVYTATNAAVAAAPGASVTAKINNVLGISPLEADSVIVSGVPGDQYQGLYFFTGGIWTFAAGYANPTAQQVPYNNSTSGLVASNVQTAVDELQATKLKTASNTPTNGQVLSWSAGSPVWVNEDSVYPTAAQVTYDNSASGIPSTNVQGALTLTWQKSVDALSEANSAQDDATAAQVTANLALGNANTALTNSINAVNDATVALNTANAALPKAGGTMTGNIVFKNGQPVDAGTY